MAFKTIEEAIVQALINDTNVKAVVGTPINKKIFIGFTRPQLVNKTSAKFPNISVSINYGPQEPALPAMLGVATIMMEFSELKENNGIPFKYAIMSLLKQHILDALAKVDFSISDIIINHFLLIGGSEPFFILEDKVWRWPLIFEFVHQDEITIGRVGVVVP